MSISLSSGYGIGLGLGIPIASDGPPSGFTWTTFNGERVYRDGLPVFDDGKNLFYMGAS